MIPITQNESNQPLPVQRIYEKLIAVFISQDFENGQENDRDIYRNEFERLWHIATVAAEVEQIKLAERKAREDNFHNQRKNQTTLYTFSD